MFGKKQPTGLLKIYTEKLNSLKDEIIYLTNKQLQTRCDIELACDQATMLEQRIKELTE